MDFIILSSTHMNLNFGYFFFYFYDMEQCYDFEIYYDLIHNFDYVPDFHMYDTIPFTSNGLLAASVTGGAWRARQLCR